MMAGFLFNLRMIPIDLAAHSIRACDRRVVFHDHVEGRTDESQGRAVEFEQHIHVGPFSYCQIHKRRTIAFEQFVYF